MDKYSKMLEEAFGEPIKLAITEPVKLEPVQVKISLDDDVLSAEEHEDGVCPDCGMMSVDGQCGCDHSSGSDEGAVCPGCGMMVVDGKCGCEHEEAQPCDSCGMMPMPDAPCGCGMQEAKKSGPTAATAKKILRGTKTFKDKMKKVSGWADDPAAAAAWMMHKATGKWPSEK